MPKHATATPKMTRRAKRIASLLEWYDHNRAQFVELQQEADCLLALSPASDVECLERRKALAKVIAAMECNVRFDDVIIGEIRKERLKGLRTSAMTMH